MEEERIERIKQILHAHNYKLTPQREATVRILLENIEDHLSAEDVFLALKDRAPDIGLATVYRTLELLSDLRIIHKINFGDGVTRYDFRSESAQHHHHHLLCVHCGKVQEIEEDYLGEVEKKIEETFHFSIIDHRLTFHGVCSECQKKQSESPEKEMKENQKLPVE
ncbi:Fur family transcriptional regulator [Thermicanus aegyptius]|uniref:ferric iron uptake transcriptional regulator n=1 Tax=Thermicanus aegyptius TaxID=94009 RepID=UPI0004217F1F|nr:Fur family transcriptional regulator [Thermicanus aegyptius]